MSNQWQSQWCVCVGLVSKKKSGDPRYHEEVSAEEESSARDALMGAIPEPIMAEAAASGPIQKGRISLRISATRSTEMVVVGTKYKSAGWAICIVMRAVQKK